MIRADAKDVPPSPGSKRFPGLTAFEVCGHCYGQGEHLHDRATDPSHVQRCTQCGGTGLVRVNA